MSYDLDSRYITVVLKLPEDQATRVNVLRHFRLEDSFEGATVTALSMGDAITELERKELESERVGSAPSMRSPHRERR